jgi:hypothetical protein
MTMPFKTCPKCNTANGVRTLVCKQCKNSFKVETSKRIVNSSVKQTNVVKVSESSVKANLAMLNGAIHTPRGKCPFNIPELTYDKIHDWVKKLQHFYSNTLSYDALLYWLHIYFPVYKTGEHGINPESKIAERLLLDCMKIR